MTLFRFILLTLAFEFGLNAVVAAAPPTPQTPADAHSVIAKMLAREPTLQSYRARVHVDIRMLNFPYLAPKLDGTSYYKRPDLFLVVFDRMPGYARSFQRLFDDIGNPRAWQKDQNIMLAGTSLLGGRPTIVLRLTKKI